MALPAPPPPPAGTLDQVMEMCKRPKVFIISTIKMNRSFQAKYNNNASYTFVCFGDFRLLFGVFDLLLKKTCVNITIRIKGSIKIKLMREAVYMHF